MKSAWILSTIASVLIGTIFGIRIERWEQAQIAGQAIMASHTSSYVSIDQYEAQEAMKQEELRIEERRLESLWEQKPILSPPPNAPPNKIKVGPYIYFVNYTSREALRNEGAWAETRLQDRVIWLNPSRFYSGNGSYDLLHELLHVARDVGTSDHRLKGTYDAEENMVEEISISLLQILKDNPQLITWLQQN